MFVNPIKGSISLLLCLMLFSHITLAQEKAYREPTGTNNWYVELGGAALLYSLNYEKILYKSTNLGFVGRVGVAYGFSDGWFLNTVKLDNGAVYAPFTTSLLLGNRERKEKLELGFGFTLINTGITSREIIPTAVLGFRVIETNKVCFRISYTPFIRNNDYQGWFGVSIGRNFSVK
ncbi:MAG: hypothetical protein EAY81_02725 [Bacteroidetes bacterium]|nr:MAG: hypothetical protein EAY81_02725 [Bacteroidota bacterium]